MSPLGYTLAVGFVAAAMAGCAGNGMGLDANGNPLTADSGASQPLTADFQSIQNNILTPICTKCHIGASAPEGLQLDQAHSYAMLVGVPSTEQPGVLRVDPGNPDSSYIVMKLQGSFGISGARMPFGGPYLSQATIDVIRQWISAGASNTSPTATAATTAGAPAAGAPAADGTAAASPMATAKAGTRAAPRFTVTASSPDANSIAVTVPRIVIAFDGDIDPNLLNGTTVSLEKLTGASDSALPVKVAVPRGNGSALLITPRSALTDGTYRVTLRGTLANMNAQALGSDFTFKFTVETP